MPRRQPIADDPFARRGERPARTEPGVTRKRARPPQISFEVSDPELLQAIKDAAHDDRLPLAEWCRLQLGRAAGYYPDERRG